ncbi:acyl-CoA dehydrogenase family protein [Granulicoccus phenolivorans]|uniref:acyl-CoA dehydrogenase family protein n=1 Tax=Granulicoccus phenolivorans TaxID=266854 RepID=UPI0004126994|nr:acyl-CoA dehydrogenase family protein [Granulicoccus phenolivorans]
MPTTVSAATISPSVITDTPQMATLRAEVRDFLTEEIAAGAFRPTPDSWLSRWDEDFSRKLAARGWLGMTIPTEYGGHGRTFLERFVVTEELLAVGAPVAAHWIADRQIAPSLLRFGTEEQKQAFLPRIAAGDMYWGIGMSEPDSGSDLASVRTRGVPVEGGWRVTGTKVWTSGAHEADAFFALARTAPLDPQHRHQGLSQFIVDLHSEGVEIRPIVSMNGEHHFNEVHLNEVFIPDNRVLGEIGSGWTGVTSELAYERSGPERYLSTFPVYAGLLDQARAERASVDSRLGATAGRLFGLHQMSRAVAGALERHEQADVAASVVKVLGTLTEGDIAEDAHLATIPGRDDEFDQLVHLALSHRPGFTLRGGTVEVLRGVIARGLGLR